MAIPESHRRDFQTLLDAAADGNLALMECSDAASGATLRYRRDRTRGWRFRDDPVRSSP
jgi:hypothetical protein